MPMRLKNKFRPNLGPRSRLRRISGGDPAAVAEAAAVVAAAGKRVRTTSGSTGPGTPGGGALESLKSPEPVPTSPAAVAGLSSPVHSPTPAAVAPVPNLASPVGSPPYLMSPGSPRPAGELKQPPPIRRTVEMSPGRTSGGPSTPLLPPLSPSKRPSWGGEGPFSPGATAGSATRTRHPSTTSVASEYGSVGRVRRLTESGGPGLAPQVPASVFDRRKADHKRKFNNGVPERNKMTMFDLIYYNPAEGSRMSTSSSRRTSRASNSSEDPLRSPSRPQGSADETVDGARRRLEEEAADDVENDGGGEEAEEVDDAMPVPQVKVGPNGEMIIDEESTLIETTAAKRAKEDLLKSPLVYETGNQPGGGGYGSWGKKRKNVDWGERETLRFYRALSVFGTDFSMMESVFKRRTRHELKMKFKKEERQNRALVDRCLREGMQFDASAFHSDTEDEDYEEEAAERKRRRRSRGSADGKSTAGGKRKAKKRVRKVRSNRGYYDDSSDGDADEESEAATGEESNSRKSSSQDSAASSKMQPSVRDTIREDLTSFAGVSPAGSPAKAATAPPARRRRAAFKPNVAKASASAAVREGSPLLKSLLSEPKAAATPPSATGSSSTPLAAKASSVSSFPPGLLAANPDLANAVPGSLLVVASPSESDPQKHMLHVYRINAAGGGGGTPASAGGAKQQTPPQPQQPPAPS